jgi:hypothetical protein
VIAAAVSTVLVFFHEFQSFLGIQLTQLTTTT